MKLDKIKRMASQILKIGESKVWINPEKTSQAMEAMTKEDIRGLIKDRIIGKKKTQGHSRGNARILKGKKKKGLKKGKGKRTGTKKSRVKKKKKWIKNVRAQRKTLKKMKQEKTETSISYREIYNKIKGGYFKGKKYVSALSKKEDKK